MSQKPLNLEGTLVTEKKKVTKSSRHTTARKIIALNYSDLRRPYATALAHWKEHALATQLVWLVLDKLGEQEIGPKETVQNVSGKEFAQKLLDELRAARS